MRTAEERSRAARAGGEATLAKYGVAFYRQISRMARKDGRPRLPLFRDSAEESAFERTGRSDNQKAAPGEGNKKAGERSRALAGHQSLGETP